MRVLVAVLVALGASTAAAVPFVLDGPFLAFNVDVPASFLAPSAHAGHAQTPAAGATGHGHAAPASGSASHEGHGATADDPAAHAVHQETPAGDHAQHGLDGPGMQRPAFPAATGKIPDSPDGMPEMGRLTIKGDSAFVTDELALPGSGTLEDPYVIRGYYFPSELSLLDTDACVVVAENWIAGQLTLNWNGQCVWVHHNHVGDLRVNENNPRTGYATGGLIEANEFGIVGQLRHYDGEFRQNVIGPVAEDALFDPVLETVPYLFLRDTRAANIDGFNQGLIHHNTFYGSVDLDFHGHHHGTGFFAPHSHYHGESGTRQKEHMHDHADRWTSVAFTDNRIVDPEGYGLRYEDENHAGDDRRANSEDMDVLNEPHVHHTDIVLARNTIEGSQIWVDVFNADDNNHDHENPGTLTIEGNTVELNERVDKGHSDICGVFFFGSDYDAWAALHVQYAKEVKTAIVGNTLKFVPLSTPADPVASLRNTVGEALHECGLWPDDHATTAIRLEDIREADLVIRGNKASGFQVGVGAAYMDDETTWTVVGNDFGKARAITYDDTVENPPRTS